VDRLPAPGALERGVEDRQRPLGDALSPPAESRIG
jgi:hypothetical protein